MANTLHRIAASEGPPIHVAAHNGMPAGWGVELGVTTVAGGNNVSFVFEKRIDGLSSAPAVGPGGVLMGAEYRNTNSAVVNARTTAHETVHFWVRSQRPGVTDQQGHCTSQQQYDDPSLTCLMHQPAGANGLDSAQIHMHYINRPTGTDSEYLIIRRAPDPVDQQ
jgi:hypothetical protein